MENEKYYYEIHVVGKNGYSTAIVSDEELEEWDIINKAVELGQIDPEDVDYVDYTDEITKEEYEERFQR